MQAVDIMTATVATVRPDTEVELALQLLTDHKVSSLPVVDDQGYVVGIVSERDLLAHAMPSPEVRRDRPSGRHLRVDNPTSVREVMTAGPYTVTADTDVRDIAQVFTTTSWKAMPVVRDRKLVGVISRSDVVRALNRDDEAVRRDLELLCAAAGHPEWRIAVHRGVVEVAGTSDRRGQEQLTRLAWTVVGVRDVRRAQANT